MTKAGEGKEIYLEESMIMVGIIILDIHSTGESKQGKQTNEV